MVEGDAIANGGAVEGRIDVFVVLAWWGWRLSRWLWVCRKLNGVEW